MKRFLMLVVAGVLALSSTMASASTNGADRILGVYKAVNLPSLHEASDWSFDESWLQGYQDDG